MTNEEQHSSESVSTELFGSTLKDCRPSADICRERGWVAGDRLIGDGGLGPRVIEITAVGERAILANSISGHGEEYDVYEGIFNLSYRDWRVLPKSHSEES